MLGRDVRLLPPVLSLLLSLLLALSWLFPNHTKPWTTFQSESWLSLILCVVAAAMVYKAPKKLELSAIGGLAFLMVLIPWGQFAFGQVYLFGTAWINSIYFLGLCLAIILGGAWEDYSPGEALGFLFLAIVVAGVVSVALQICQLLQIDGLGIWVLNVTGRFSANLGQPNMLSTLFLLGVVGVVWSFATDKVGGGICIVLVAWLLLGVVLTESRTAWLNFAALTFILYLFFREGRPKYFGAILLCFIAYVLMLNYAIPLIKLYLYGDIAALRGLYDSYRIAIWHESLALIFKNPYFGYGFGQIQEAYFSSNGLPYFGGPLSHAHNIILDILLSCGFVLGSFILLSFCWVFSGFVRKLRSPYYVFPFLAFLILIIHALLELPLHYAYFLLPFGMILGVLGQKSGAAVLCLLPKWVVGITLGVAAFALAITIIDCFEVERTVNKIHYWEDGQKNNVDDQPNVYVLNQWSSRLKLANSTPGLNLTEERYRWMKGVVVSTPSPFMYYIFSQHLAMNGRYENALYWLNVLCKASPKDAAEQLFLHWQELSGKNSNYRSVGWEGCIN